LAPFGEWIMIEGLGRVWLPRVALELGWHPYGRGQWISTDLGWAWSSDEAWGDERATPYRYGRWTLEARVGWVWVPDIVWAPSWVTWRSCDGWIGWAPTPPPRRWGGAVVETPLAVEAFVFVPSRKFLEPRPVMFRANVNERAEVFARATPVTETVVV